MQDVIEERIEVAGSLRVGAPDRRELRGETAHGGGGREDLRVGGGHEAQHGRTSVSIVGRAERAPASISAARAAVSR
jgi:hypothetical protein